MKRAEEEKATASQELIAARVEVAGLKEDAEKAQGGTTELRDKLEKLSLELEYATKRKEEVSPRSVMLIVLRISLELEYVIKRKEEVSPRSVMLIVLRISLELEYVIKYKEE